VTDREKERKKEKEERKRVCDFFGYFSELQVLEHRVGEVLIL